MPNEGFRGSVVSLDKVTITSGPGSLVMVQCSVQFAESDGTVHAVAQSQFSFDPEMPDDGTLLVVNDLLARLRRTIARQHFLQPEAAPQSVLRGIAETLQGASSDSDEPGAAG